WNSIMGKFMFFLPVTLIITLTASLLVAYIINPAFAVRFMKPHHPGEKADPKKGLKVTFIIFGIVILLSYLSGNIGVGNFAILMLLLNLLNRFYLKKRVAKFMNVTWPKVQNKYRILLIWCLRRPVLMIVGIVGLFFLSIGM